MGVSWGTWWCVLNARLHRDAGESSPSREETLPPQGLLSVSRDLIRAPVLLDQGLPIQWTVTDFLFWGSKITQHGDRNHKTRRRLLLRRKAMTNLDSVFKT